MDYTIRLVRKILLRVKMQSNLKKFGLKFTGLIFSFLVPIAAVTIMNADTLIMGSSETYTTIRTTINTAGETNIIQVKDGTYDENMRKAESRGFISMSAIQAADLSNLNVYPNPFKPNDGDSDTGTWATGIIFENFPANTTIGIYTLTGEEVGKEEALDVSWKWDGYNKAGDKVASGIYLYFVKNAGAKKTGQLVIIK